MKLEQVDHTDLIGRLPKAFIGVALMNFLVGASLGGWMTIRPAVWSSAGLIHGEINPFGWLTMLIYGMAYAVLSISAGIRPPKAWMGWLHLLLSELAVVVVTAAFLTNVNLLLQVGLACQFAASVLFLVNILSGVLSTRRIRNGTQQFAPDAEQTHALVFLRHSPIHQGTDRVAQRGTDVSLVLLVIGTGWLILNSFNRQNSPSGGTTPQGALFLVYYGWISGTVLAVSLHLFPRFIGTAKIGLKVATFGQAIWGFSVFLGTVGSIWSPVTARFGYRLLGVAFIWFAVVYLRALLTRNKVPGQKIRVPRSSLSAWYASWTFCLALGIFLVFGLDPLSLAAMHLLFLAFATNLVYGVGYTLFPLLLLRRPPSETLAMAQVAAAILGVLLMVIAFLDMLSLHPHGTFTLLGIGGTLAAVSAMVFLLQWPFSKRA